MDLLNTCGLSWSHKATEIQSEMMKSDEKRIYQKHDTMMCGALMYDSLFE
jgi:hypothetical protein